MAQTVIDYRQPDLSVLPLRLKAAKLGITSIAIFIAIVLLAGLLAMFGPDLYFRAWFIPKSMICCLAIIGILWGIRGVQQDRRCALAWIGFLLNLIGGLGGLGYFALVQFILTHMDT